MSDLQIGSIDFQYSTPFTIYEFSHSLWCSNMTCLENLKYLDSTTLAKSHPDMMECCLYHKKSRSFQARIELPTTLISTNELAPSFFWVTNKNTYFGIRWLIGCFTWPKHNVVNYELNINYVFDLVTMFFILEYESNTILIRILEVWKEQADKHVTIKMTK